MSHLIIQKHVFLTEQSRGFFFNRFQQSGFEQAVLKIRKSWGVSYGCMQACGQDFINTDLMDRNDRSINTGCKLCGRVRLDFKSLFEI